MKNTLLFLSTFLILSPLLQAQNVPTRTGRIDPFRRNQIGLETPICFGLTQLQVGTTSNRQPLTVSFGGGSSIGIRFGTMVNKRIQLSLGVAVQSAGMKPPVANASGHFFRVNLNPAFRFYMNTLTNNSRFYLGAGVMISTVNNLVLDATAINGQKQVLTYDLSPGVSIEVGYEMFFTPSISLDLGLRYRYNDYYLKSITVNGQNYPVNQLGAQDQKYKNVDGSGVDIMAAFRVSF